MKNSIDDEKLLDVSGGVVDKAERFDPAASIKKPGEKIINPAGRRIINPTADKSIDKLVSPLFTKSPGKLKELNTGIDTDQDNGTSNGSIIKARVEEEY